MGGDLESPGFAGDQGLFIDLAARVPVIQLHQIIFEHTFNIKGSPDISRRLDRLPPADNTPPIRTTSLNRTAPNAGERFRRGAAPRPARLGRSFAGHPAGQAIRRMATGKLSVASRQL